MYKRQGDIEAVFKNPASQIKRASAPLMLNAIENGGRKLDCYGIDLVQNYNKFGFEPVARVAWNPEYAPDGWTYGPKDVYVMKLADGLDADGVKARLGFSESDGGFHKWTQPELDALPEMDYDAALAYRDSLFEQSAKPVAERVDGAASSVSARVQPLSLIHISACAAFPGRRVHGLRGAGRRYGGAGKAA